MSNDPYVARGPISDASSSPDVERCGPRVLLLSLGVGAAFAVVAAVVTTVQLSFGMMRFDGLSFVPAVVGLSAVRGWGRWGATMAPVMTSIVVVHRAGRRHGRDGGVRAIDPRLPGFAAMGVAAVYPLLVAVGCAAACAVWCAFSGSTPRAFASKLLETLRPVDIAYAGAATALGALIVATGVRLAGGAFLSRRAPLALKLFLAWVVLQVVAYGIGWLGRWIA